MDFTGAARYRRDFKPIEDGKMADKPTRFVGGHLTDAQWARLERWRQVNGWSRSHALRQLVDEAEMIPRVPQRRKRQAQARAA